MVAGSTGSRFPRIRLRYCPGRQPHAGFLRRSRSSTRRRSARNQSAVLWSRAPAFMPLSRFEYRVTVQSLFDRCQDGRTLVFNEYDEKFRRLRFAGVATDNVNVIGTFIESLTRVKGDLLRPLDLHDYGTFQHIDKCVRVVAMDWVCCTGRILDDQHRALFAR